jgi:SAM-dependent methyltransferase
MICCICENDNWENVDELARFKPEGMSICTTCGFISYPQKYKTEEEIKQYYRKDYRNNPSAGNLYSGQRKLHYHNDFLKDVFVEFNSESYKNSELNVFEVGAAFGMALKNIKNQVPHANIYGSELTRSFRRNAFQEFGIDLVEDFDQSKQYDLIMSYKVAEHQLDIHLRMKEYYDCLKENGYLYISIPAWFDSLENFGAQGFDLNYYYDTNHINVWTKKHFEGLLEKSNFEIIKQDHICYGSTYLCKKRPLNEALSIDEYFENPEVIKEKLKTIKQVYVLSQESRYEEALKLWPNYPIAHANRFELIRKDAFKKGWDFLKTEVIDFAISSCPRSPDVFLLGADIALRSKKFKECIEFVNQYLEIRTNAPHGYILLINCLREMALSSKSEKEKQHYFTQARDASRTLGATSLQHQKESLDFIYLFNSHLEKEV